MCENKRARVTDSMSYARMCGNGGHSKMPSPHEGLIGPHEII